MIKLFLRFRYQEGIKSSLVKIRLLLKEIKFFKKKWAWKKIKNCQLTLYQSVPQSNKYSHSTDWTSKDPWGKSKNANFAASGMDLSYKQYISPQWRCRESVMTPSAGIISKQPLRTFCGSYVMKPHGDDTHATGICTI
jgi:hypothetical protein